MASRHFVRHRVLLRKDEDALGDVFAQQLVEERKLPLATAEQTQEALASEEGAPCLRVAGREPPQFHQPARTVAAWQLSLAHKVDICGVVGVIASALGGREINAQALRAVVCEWLADEILAALRVNDGTDQFIDAPAPIGLLVRLGIRCGQSQAQGRWCHQGRLTPTGSGQVVHLIEDDQLEGIARRGHQIASRVIRRHGERLDAFLAAVVDAHVGGKRVYQACVPLVQQVDGGRDNDGGAFDAIDRLNRDEGLPRSGGQDDAAAASRLVPGDESLQLIVVRLSYLPQGHVKRLPAPHIVPYSQVAQLRLEFAIMIALTTPPSLDKAKRCGKRLLFLILLYNQSTALKEDRCAH